MITIAAVVIAKNEAAVIRRCLKSLQGKVDVVFMHDTGSEDGTQEIARSMGAVVVSRPWANFGANRTAILQEAAPMATHLLIVDADQTLEGELPRANCDAGVMTLKHGGMSYDKIQIVRSCMPWRYVGDTHEYLTCDWAFNQTRISSAWLVEHADSSRRTYGRKFPEDIALLEQAIAANPNDARSTFYLAQTYDDMVRSSPTDFSVTAWRDRSRSLYARRTTMGGWEQEVYVSLLRLGDIQSALRAIKIDPARWEAYHLATLLLNDDGQFEAAEALSRRGMNVSPNRTGLFSNDAVYDSLLMSEHMRALKGMRR